MSNSSLSNYDNDVQELRTQINIVDEAIVDLLKKRMDLVIQVREFKSIDQMPSHNMAREKQVIENVANSCTGLTKEFVARVYCHLLEITRELADKKTS